MSTWYYRDLFKFFRIPGHDRFLFLRWQAALANPILTSQVRQKRVQYG